MKYDFIIEPSDAKAITHKSEEAYKQSLKITYEEIRKAAEQGSYKVLLPSFPTRDIEDKVKEHLTIMGYKLGWWDSTTCNTTIHWQ